MTNPTIFKFSGEVVVGTNPDQIEIGGVSVISELESHFGYGKKGAMVIVQIEDLSAAGELLKESSFAGELEVDSGAEGYSSWTPGENSMFCVGEADLLDRLIAREGDIVNVTVGLV